LKGKKREKVIELMRLQSSAIRFIYNRLKKDKTDNEIYKLTQEKFNSLPSWYINSAIRKAKQYPTDKPVVFGGRKNFEKLCKNHFQGKARERFKKQ
jgi:predicted transposase